ncbi:MAG TPA: copper chaperone CopZ [Bacillus sp. (in: firmicutes)]|jgi:copper chaperone|nr:copper chaperone CopZ [Bacillus sp. (in: firmicutes)]
MEHVSLDVKGMSCEHCVKAVETNVGILNGVDRVEVHLKEGKVEVEFNPEQVSIETVKSTIEDQGYDVAK